MAKPAEFFQRGRCRSVLSAARSIGCLHFAVATLGILLALVAAARFVGNAAAIALPSEADVIAQVARPAAWTGEGPAMLQSRSKAFWRSLRAVVRMVAKFAPCAAPRPER